MKMPNPCQKYGVGILKAIFVVLVEVTGFVSIWCEKRQRQEKI